MMFAYINLHSLVPVSVVVSELEHVLAFRGWGDPSGKRFYSSNDVLADPLRYPEDIERVKRADLKCPIIMHNDVVVDGVHRLTRSKLQRKKTIKAYVFDDALMDKFLVNDRGEWAKADALPLHELIEMFVKRKLYA